MKYTSDMQDELLLEETQYFEGTEDSYEDDELGLDDELESELDATDDEDQDFEDRSESYAGRSTLSRSRESKGKKLVWDKERTRKLFRRYKLQGDEYARDQLITSHLNLVRFLAYKFKNRGEPVDDLIQVGTIGLIKAIDRFDIERGLEFTTYATPTILGEIKRHFRDKGWSVRVPRRLQELSAKVNQANDELTQILQRSPKLEEIAEHLSVSVDEVLEAMESGEAYSSVPLETDNSSDDDVPSVIDRYGEEDKNLTGSDDRIVLTEVLEGFTPKEQEVIRLRFLDGLTQIEIANHMGISQVQVSRLLRRTLKRMQDKIGLGLKGYDEL